MNDSVARSPDFDELTGREELEALRYALLPNDLDQSDQLTDELLAQMKARCGDSAGHGRCHLRALAVRDFGAAFRLASAQRRFCAAAIRAPGLRL